jgi:hypothetical protein
LYFLTDLFHLGSIQLCLARRLATDWLNVALNPDRVVGLFEPGQQFIVEVISRANVYEVAAPFRAIVRGLDDTRAFQPAPEREANPEAVLPRR